TQRIGLREPVEVEDGDPVLLAEPADRLRVERLARRAHDAELLWVTAPCVRDAHHRADRSRRREHVRDFVPGEEVELLMRIEAALALVDDLGRAKPPRTQQRADP